MRNVSLELTNLRQRELASLFNQLNELNAQLNTDSAVNLNDRLALIEQSLVNLTSRGGGPIGEEGSSGFRRLRRRVNILTN